MGLLSGWPLFLQRQVTMLGFKLLRLIIMTIQKVHWFFNGTAQKIKESRRPENYNRCAHVLDIVIFYKFEFAHKGSVKDYILSHNRFESPQYIFDNDHVSLITFDEENAIFGVANQKDMQLWRLECHSFMRIAQVLHCNQLILVPLNHFHRMAEELGEPKGQLIFLINTGRCGSTLLTQMMQATEKCIAISEPESLSALALRYKRNGDSPELRQLTQDVVRWTCRPYKNITALAYMLKFRPDFSFALPIFKQVYPMSKCLFMYRNVIKVAQSYFRLSKELSTAGRKNTRSVVLGLLPTTYSGMEIRLKGPDSLLHGFTIAIGNCKSYLGFRRDGLEVSAVRYEDIVNDKHYAARTILEFCGLPLSLEEDFLRGLDFDSQRNSNLSQKLMAKHKDIPLNPEFERMANEVLRMNGLPIIKDDWILEGTISCRG